MNVSLISNMEIWLLVASFGVASLSGVIKGSIGFGMPLVMLSGLSSFLDPKLALEIGRASCRERV